MRKEKYARWQYQIIKKALNSRRVLILVGPRQCGKTTLAKELASADTIYRTLDDATLLDAALNDPQSFVRHNDEMMIIDEVQRAPLLLQSIKQEVDIHQAPGRYLLTGSANIQSLPHVSESLAGRVRNIRLRPLARAEINHNQPSFLKNAFLETFIATDQNDDKDAYISYALEGGYPEPRNLEKSERQRWHQDYLEALLSRDLKDIINIRRQDSMGKLLEVLAAWSSKFIDISAIGANLALARQTIESYINALEALYLVERVRAWSKTDYDRVSKQNKLFMTDTGTMAAILRWKLDNVRLDGDKNGKLLETFVFTQLASHIDAQEGSYQLYHYRDREKREIDFIIENEEGDILGIEVKSGSIVNNDSFKHLKWFKEHMAKHNNFIGVVLYTGNNIVRFGEGMWAVPINVLF